jgi:hypothetical protein
VKIKVLTEARELSDKITREIKARHGANYSIVTYVYQGEFLALPAALFPAGKQHDKH